MDLQQRRLGNSISDRFIDGETDPIGWLFGGGECPRSRITTPDEDYGSATSDHR